MPANSAPRALERMWEEESGRLPETANPGSGLRAATMADSDLDVRPASEQAILDMVAYESLTRSEFGYAEHLAEKGLDAGEGLEKLSADVRKNAEATAAKIIRVVVRGEEVFHRP